MQQINTIAHTTNDIHPRTGEKIIEQFSLKSKQHETQNTQIENHIVHPIMLWLIKIKNHKNRDKTQ